MKLNLTKYTSKPLHGNPCFLQLAPSLMMCECNELFPVFDKNCWFLMTKWKDVIHPELYAVGFPNEIINIIGEYIIPILFKSYLDLVIYRQAPKYLKEIHNKWHNVSSHLWAIKEHEKNCSEGAIKCEDCKNKNNINATRRLLYGEVWDLKKKHRKICKKVTKITGFTWSSLHGFKIHELNYSK